MPPKRMEGTTSHTPAPKGNNDTKEKKKPGRPKGSKNTKHPQPAPGGDSENHRVDHPRRDRKTPDRFSQTGYSVRAGGYRASKPRGRKAVLEATSKAKLRRGRSRTNGKGKLGGLQAEVEKIVDDALGRLTKKLAKALREYGR